MRAVAFFMLIAISALVASALFSVESAHACFYNVNPPPAPNMHLGPDCVWRFADGTTAAESHDSLWRAILISLGLLTTLGAAMIAIKLAIRPATS